MVDFSDYISMYGNDVGLPNLTLNENNICALSFDSKINVDIVFRKEQDQIILASKLGSIPPDNQESFFRELLKINAYGLETAGAAIGIDEPNFSVVMSYTMIIQAVNYDLFKTILGNFVDLVEEWMQKLETLQTSSNLMDDSSSMDMAPDMTFARV
jgi:hypothetical protein